MKEVNLTQRVGGIQVKVHMATSEAWHSEYSQREKNQPAGMEEGRGSTFRQAGVADTSSGQRSARS